MTNLEFLRELEKRLSKLPEKDVKKAIDFYTEILDDYKEDGLDTDSAVEKMGGIDKIVSDIMNEKEPQGTEKSPEGISLNVNINKKAFAFLKAALYCALAAGIFICSLSAIALAVSAVVSIFAGFSSLFGGSAAAGFFTIGSALVLGGASVIIGVLSFCMIKSWKSLTENGNTKSKGEKTNDNS